MPALRHWIYADDGIPARQTAIVESLHLLLVGCAGILNPIKPLSFPPLPGLTSYGETDMRTLLPTCLAAELHGFNGCLWKTPEVIWRQESWQAFAPVTIHITFISAVMV